RSRRLEPGRLHGNTRKGGGITAAPRRKVTAKGPRGLRLYAGSSHEAGPGLLGREDRIACGVLHLAPRGADEFNGRLRQRNVLEFERHVTAVGVGPLEE